MNAKQKRKRKCGTAKAISIGLLQPQAKVSKTRVKNARNAIHGEDPELLREFNKRADRWRKDTSFQSSLAAKFMHEDYQTIMAMGPPVIPLILNRLRTAHEHWFWALRHLARKDVAAGADNPTTAAKAWITWGKEKGYID
jgi:hypothetical protein